MRKDLGTLSIATGPILVGLCYHPTSDVLETLGAELDKFLPQAMFTLLIGDFNVHNIQWLRYSRELPLLVSYYVKPAMIGI